MRQQWEEASATDKRKQAEHDRWKSWTITLTSITVMLSPVTAAGALFAVWSGVHRDFLMFGVGLLFCLPHIVVRVAWSYAWERAEAVWSDDAASKPGHADSTHNCA
ncbi:hypothetical protein [Azospirillum sp. sgz302134]